jgi:hypothetical protein
MDGKSKNIWDKFMAGNSAHDGETIYVLRHRPGNSDVREWRDQGKALEVNQKPWHNQY